MGLVSFNLPEKTKARGDDGNVLKRRLLGAAVLIALAVIVLPLLLDGSGSESRFRRVEQLRVEPPRILDKSGRVELPPKPEPVQSESTVAVIVDANQDEAGETAIEIITEPADTNPLEVETVEADTDRVTVQLQPPAVVEPAVQTDRNIPDAEPAVQTDRNIPDADVDPTAAWIVQVGSFRDESNAISVRNTLRDTGFPTFISAKDTDTGPLFQVKVGPITDRQRVDEVQQQVQAQLGQPAIVKEYR